MKHAIVHVKIPDTARPAYATWCDLLEKIESIRPPLETVKRLSAGVWQIELQGSMPFLAAIFQSGYSQGLKVRVLFFDHEPDWVAL